MLTSVAPIEFQGHRYRWKLELTVGSGGTSTVSLTNDNAAVEGAPTPAGPNAVGVRADPATALFERLSRSVFRIQAGLAHGTDSSLILWGVSSSPTRMWSRPPKAMRSPLWSIRQHGFELRSLHAIRKRT